MTCGSTCCEGTACCNSGTTCQTKHSNGLGQFFFDCAALGTYDLRKSMGVSAASDALAHAPSSAATSHTHDVLALRPGLRLEQIADRVGALPGHDRSAFLALAQSGQIRSKYQGNQTSVEGFTWPDTYFVEGLGDAEILQTIVSQFDRHADAVGLANTAATGLTPQQTVVVASLVQAEAGTAAVEIDVARCAQIARRRSKHAILLEVLG